MKRFFVKECDDVTADHKWKRTWDLFERKDGHDICVASGFESRVLARIECSKRNGDKLPPYMNPNIGKPQ